VKFHLNRFLRRVRIHGGEFDTSARAMYRDEVVYPLQAESRIVRGSTIERKQMSTKTTFKRVALVAVAALGLGVLSVAPSQAATQADTLSISATTAAIKTGETATATLTGTFVSGTAAYADTLTVVASATSLPSAVLPTLTASDTSNAVVTVDAGGLSATIMNVAAAATATSGKITVDVVVPLGSAAGTYAYKFTPTVQGGGTLNSAAVTFTVTVTAAPADDTVVSAATSTTWLQTGESVSASAAADSATVVAKAVVTTAQAATIKVVVKNAAGTTLTQPALTVLVKSGTPGTVGHAGDSATAAAAMTSTGRALTTTAGHLIGIFADGTEGVSEVEIYAGTILLATKKVTFYGAVASYGVTNDTKVIAVDGTGVLTVTGADKAANVTAAPSVYATSSDSSVASVPTTAGETITVTGVKSGKATITLCDTAACTAATITKTIDVLVGATTAKTVTITFDKPTPTAGEKVTATVTALDASGNAVADGARLLLAAGGFSSSVSVANNSSTIPTIETVTLVSGTAEYIFYAPAAGVVTFTATEGTDTDSTTKGTITGSVTVMNPALDAATAAAELAEAAAQDATDAALDATEAATLAGALAQEAVDAVADLSVEVTKLIGALKAQITKLTNLVIKIQKKIK